MSNRLVPVALLILALALGGCVGAEGVIAEVLHALYSELGLEGGAPGAGSGGPNPDGMAGGGVGPGG